jgi:hypothetical protein
VTLILALDCADGLVLASDGQGTYETGGQPVKGVALKVHQYFSNIAWGGSGDVGLIQRVDHAFRTTFPSRTCFENKEPFAIRDEISRTIAVTLRPLLLDRHIGFGNAQPPLTAFIFAGHVPQGSFIFEVGHNLLDIDHTETGFSAIGSGDIFPYFAMASLAHFRVRTRTLDWAKIVAYRVVDDAINVAAMGLGPPIQIVEIKKPGNRAGMAHLLDENELLALKSSVLAWKEIETETLTQLFGQQVAGS